MKTKFPAESPRRTSDLVMKIGKSEDAKIRRILAMIDQSPDANINETILGPHRARLAIIKPARPYRFTRLLFAPVDSIIVAPNNWAFGIPTLPRTVLGPISRVIRSGLGSKAAATIDKIFIEKSNDADETIKLAGTLLWKPGAEILASSVPPLDWAETGIRPSVYPVLCNALAAVLRRAARMERLTRNESIMTSCENVIQDIFLNLANESEPGCAMLIQLIMLKSPDAIPQMKLAISQNRKPNETAVLRRSLASATEATLNKLGQAHFLANEIGSGALKRAGKEVHRINTLLRELESDLQTPGGKTQVVSAQEKLSEVCSKQLCQGVREGIISPLTAGCDPLDRDGRQKLEASARDLRSLETSARSIRNSKGYDGLLLEASNSVRSAVLVGRIPMITGVRLVEIFSGAAAASTMHTTLRS